MANKHEFRVYLSWFSVPCKLTSFVSRHCFYWQAESESVDFSFNVDFQEPERSSRYLASPTSAPACFSNQIEASTEPRISSRKPATGLRTFRPLPRLARSFATAILMEQRLGPALVELNELLDKASEELHAAIQFALIGGLAVAAWGVTRATHRGATSISSRGK